MKAILSRTNKDEVLKSLKEGNIINIISLIPTIADEILIDSDKKYHTIELINQILPNKCKHSDAMKPSVYLTLGVLSLLNNFYALSSFPVATLGPYILEKLENLISSDFKPLFDEMNVRDFSKKYLGDEFQTFTNAFLNELFKKTHIRHMNTYSYDCSEIPVCFGNEHNEKSEVITGKHDKLIRGYKLGILHGILPHDESYPCEIKFGSLKEHDLTFSKKLLTESKWLKKGNTLLIDRGFIDHELLRTLNEKGVACIIPAKWKYSRMLLK